MSITQTISSFPTPLPDRDNDTPTEFSDHVDKYINHINTHISEVNTWAGQANDLADAMNEEIYSRFRATSSSSVSIGTGSKSFALVEDHRAFFVGSYVRVVDSNNPATNYMEGVVTSYDDSTDTLAVNVSTTGGSGTISAWSIALAGSFDTSAIDQNASNINRNTDNILLNAFHIAINDSLSKFGMVDGVVDEFEDGTSVANKDWFWYLSSSKLYSMPDVSDVSTAIYTGKYVNVSSYANNPHAVRFSTDGSKMYVLDGGGDSVYQYTLSTSWDVSTASYASKYFYVGNEDTGANGLAFSSDGTRMYMAGVITDTVYQYTLSTAWDVSTASYASKYFYVGSEDGNANGVAFNSNGTKMYIAGNDNGHIYQYNLSTAWDVSTASYNTYGISTYGGDLYDLAFSSDGSHLYLAMRPTTYLGSIYMYPLSTSWDVTTAGSYTYVDVNSQVSYPYGVCIGSEDYYLYFGGSSNKIYQYVVKNHSTASLESVTETADSTPSEVECIVREKDVSTITLNTDILVYASRDGGTTYTQGTLDEIATIDNTRVLKATMDLSGQPSGTSMRYKVEMNNTKRFELHGVGMLWD